MIAETDNHTHTHARTDRQTDRQTDMLITPLPYQRRSIYEFGQCTNHLIAVIM